MFYFKDIDNGIGISNSQNIVGDITWITKEEYDELVIENDAKTKAAEEAAENRKAELQEKAQGYDILMGGSENG